MSMRPPDDDARRDEWARTVGSSIAAVAVIASLQIGGAHALIQLLIWGFGVTFIGWLLMLVLR